MKKRERSRTAADLALPSSACVCVEITEAATRGAICPDDIGRFSSDIFSGRARSSPPDRGTVRASVSRVPEPAPEHDDRPENKNAATEIAGCAGKGRSIQGGRRSTEKNFDRDDPRAASKLGFSISCLQASSVTAALRPPLLLAACRLTVAALRFPFLPPARLLSTRFTAIARQWMLGPVNTVAALQQTDPAPGTTDLTLTPSGFVRTAILIFGRS